MLVLTFPGALEGCEF